MTKKIVLITGTNSGFGWLTAKSVAALGHKVYATMRDTNDKNADKAKALSAVENITVVDVELTNEENVQKVFGEIISKEGKIDVLVNNAGYAAYGVAESFTTKDVQDMLDVHVIAYWRLIKLALPYMRKQEEGLIVNVSSGSGRLSFPFMTVYSAAKFGLEGLSEGLHYEVKSLGIDVTVVEPGAYPTDIFGKVRTGSDLGVNDGYGSLLQIPEQMEAGLTQLLETVKPNPQDVADAIVNLINTPKGQRPLRTVVDHVTGHIIKASNDAVQVQHQTMLRDYGMGDLLK
ncbi:SDR family oxidoreductase [Flavobacterium sp. CYK-4]|uniref:SDR family oxidoreductase n=1 Tax=Flavobacterium lotistagni TaxID=2709660 RepID=UPI00140CF65E|nr:SDR family oxidoreductase [Flavobacterium lotistagni]NHM07644.1 SDR family oxidoreductase [Flavobacterium lotistagni]